MSGYDLNNNTTVLTATTTSQAFDMPDPYTTLHVRTEADLYVAIGQAADANSFLQNAGTSICYHVEVNEAIHFRTVTGTGEVRLTAMAGAENGNETSVAGTSGGGGGGGDASAANQDEQTAVLEDILTRLLATLSVSASSLPLPSGAATAAAQSTGNTTLASILTALASVAVTGPLTSAQLSAAALATAAGQTSGNTKLDSIISALGGNLAITAAALPLPSGAATAAAQSTGNTTLASILTALSSVAVTGPLTSAQLSAAALATAAGQTSGNTKLDSIITALGAALTVQPTAAQDPVYDHANGEVASVTASALILTPPAGCRYARVTTDIDIVVNTAGAAAVDDGTGLYIQAGVPEVIPVVAATGVYALSLDTIATVRIMPMKART